MATATDLKSVKERLYKQFNRACDLGDGAGDLNADARAANRNAAGTLGNAIVALEREERERAQETKSYQLVGKP